MCSLVPSRNSGLFPQNVCIKLECVQLTFSKCSHVHFKILLSLKEHGESSVNILKSTELYPVNE